MHVYIEHGYLFSGSLTPVVLEVGFGTGLNCLLTALQAEKLKRDTTYRTLDNNLLPPEIIKQLNYDEILPGRAKSLFSAIHAIGWEEETSVSEYFKLQKIYADITKADWRLKEAFNIIYYDAFGPDKQPEIWSETIFRKIFEMTMPEGILVTYSAKGEVRRRLAGVGFTMERVKGPPGKKEMLRGIKRSFN
jgi:tRNA U34 5-methylaminomethyl-2-thiouridine-forming methyltransferase MnmC